MKRLTEKTGTKSRGFKKSSNAANYSFDCAIKGLGVVKKWDSELAIKK